MTEYDPSTAAGLFAAGGWQRPGFCGPNGGNCVEVNLTGGDLVGVRDSKSSGGPVLVFDRQEWSAFLDAARSGQFDTA